MKCTEIRRTSDQIAIYDNRFMIFIIGKTLFLVYYSVFIEKLIQTAFNFNPKSYAMQ